MRRITQVEITDRNSISRATAEERRAVVASQEAALGSGEEQLEAAIARKALYFRVSIIGSCNLACTFCHNEGGPDQGRIDDRVFDAALKAAASVGFKRVQLTGGEPLLDRRLPELVKRALGQLPDVGITTNGTRLAAVLPQLITQGITRVHVSLQKETLERHDGVWALPAWLDEIVQSCTEHGVYIRFNLPVDRADVDTARRFLRGSPGTFSVNVFALLKPQRDLDGNTTKYLEELATLTSSADDGPGPAVSMRKYLLPNGRRCGSCRQNDICTEASRSLRLGVDGQLRPCLATRYWDSPFRLDDPLASLRDATYLALDY